jgi:hypothetical protein
MHRGTIKGRGRKIKEETPEASANRAIALDFPLFTLLFPSLSTRCGKMAELMQFSGFQM